MLRSNRVVDSVVVKTRAHIRTGEADDAAAIKDAVTDDDFQSGSYTLAVAENGKAFRLVGGPERSVVQEGTLPDSVGRTIGLRWYVEPQGGEREIKFYLARIRDAADELRNNLQTFAPERSQFLTAQLTADSPDRAAYILNTWVDEFVAVAATLKKGRTTEYLAILESQLGLAQERLRAAETSLEGLRATTITAQGTSAIAGGVEATRDPLTREFLSNRLALDEVRRDRQALEAALAAPGGVSPSSLAALTAVVQGNDALRSALTELTATEGRLRQARQFYGEEHVSVRDLVMAVESLRRQTLPQAARAALEQLTLREQGLTRSVNAFSSELRRVPERSIEEARRRREVAVAEELYATVLSRYNEARLGAAALGPDVSIFDAARPPRTPSTNPRRNVAAAGLAGGIALAGLLVFLLDLTDRKLRDPEQVTTGLRLETLGFVPKLPKGEGIDSLLAAQAVEAFRSLRLRLQHELSAVGGKSLVVTSPGIGDGKSLVTQNLAISYAEAGLRTLVIDGDIRRGVQHTAFGVPQAPGLVDLLEGTATRDVTVLATSTPNLWVLPCGTRHRRVPELLDRARLSALLESLQQDFDIVLLDSAPLGAGVDAYALGMVATATVLVVRVDHSDVRIADAKLEVADRLPIRVIGAVLNGVVAKGSFEYYSYYSDYLLADREPVRQLGGGEGRLPSVQ